MELNLRGERLVLSQAETTAIHDAAVEVLRDVGIRVDDERLISLLRALGRGVEVSGAVVRFSPCLVEETVERAAHDACARQPSGVTPSAPRRLTVNVRGRCVQIHHHETGQVRAATKADLERATILSDAIDLVSVVSPLFLPQEVPNGTHDVHGWDVILRRTQRHGSALIMRPGAAKWVVEMCEVAVGGKEALRARPLFRHSLFMTSPLRVTSEEAAILLEVYDLGMPVGVGTMPVAGATAPITLAGALTLAHAEVLAGWVLLAALGSEGSSSGGPVVMDYRTGATCYSGPERMLFQLAQVDLMRHCGFPDPVVVWDFTDSIVPDIQAGIERAYGTMLGVAAGLGGMIRGGLIGPGGLCGSLLQVVVDVEWCRVINRILRGIEVDRERLAVDVIKEVGIGGQYLDHLHTVRFLRQEIWAPEVFCRTVAEKWNAERRSAIDNATDRVREILSRHDPHYLSEEQERELDRIVAMAEQAAREGKTC